MKIKTAFLIQKMALVLDDLIIILSMPTDSSMIRHLKRSMTRSDIDE